MKTIAVSKALPIGGVAIADTTIVISGQPPQIPANIPCNVFEQRYRGFYESEGKRLFDALKSSLPGGTLDALLVEIMQNRACLLCVPLFEEQK